MKMLTLIFANGELATPPDFPDLLARTDLIIAADGGVDHCARLGIVPDLVVGDLDSADSVVLQQFQKEGTVVHRHPPEKDATDLELSLDLALARGAGAVWLLGALGGRWDMSLSNIMLCALDKYRDLLITVSGADCRLQILHPGVLYTVHPIHPGRKVSLLPLKGEVRGIRLTGFKYPLLDTDLPFGSSRGVSNVITDETGTVWLQHGVLLCICLENE